MLGENCPDWMCPTAPGFKFRAPTSSGKPKARPELKAGPCKKEWTLPEAAEYYDYSQSGLRTAVLRGKLKAEKRGKFIYILDGEVRRFFDASAHYARTKGG